MNTFVLYPRLSVRSLHLEYQVWIHELNFAKEEIGIFEKHLERIVNRNADPLVFAGVEHFQNQFIRHRDVIDELRHRLHGSEVQLARFVWEMSGMGIDSVRMDNHADLRGEVIRFREIYAELKKEFRRFESEWI